MNRSGVIGWELMNEPQPGLDVKLLNFSSDYLYPFYSRTIQGSFLSPHIQYFTYPLISFCHLFILFSHPSHVLFLNSLPSPVSIILLASSLLICLIFPFPHSYSSPSLLSFLYSTLFSSPYPPLPFLLFYHTPNLSFSPFSYLPTLSRSSPHFSRASFPSCHRCARWETDL